MTKTDEMYVKDQVQSIVQMLEDQRARQQRHADDFKFVLMCMAIGLAACLILGIAHHLGYESGQDDATPFGATQTPTGKMPSDFGVKPAEKWHTLMVPPNMTNCTWVIDTLTCHNNDNSQTYQDGPLIIGNVDTEVNSK